jgi:hypothetical protein
MATGAVIARILTQYSDKGSKAAQKDITKLGNNFDAFAKKSARAFGLVAAASAAFAIKIGTDAVQAAIQDQKSQTMLANTLRNTVGATDAAIAGTETYITAMQKQFSVVDDDLRPAMASLVAVTGSVTAAQSLMQTALDVSANKGVDLASAVAAIVAGTRGQYKALAKLVPGLDSATLATKDYGKILEKVSVLTAGSASKRAQTLEYRLMGLKIAFGEILETLGYALLPILQKFAATVSTKILPQIEAWVALNKDKLAASFQVASDYAIKFLSLAITFGNWVSNNTGKVQILAGIIAGMFAIGRIAAFVNAISTVTKAMAVLRATAIGAAIASAIATGGVSVATAATALAAVGATALVTKNLFSLMNNDPSKSATKTDLGKNPVQSGSYLNGSSVAIDPNAALNAWLAGLSKNTTAIKKNTKSVMNIATENARKELAARQAALSGSSSLAIGAAGSNPFGTAKNVTVVVNNAGSVITEENLVTTIVNGIERTTRRSFGTVGAFDR